MKLITYNGVTQSVYAWAKELNTPPYVLYERLKKGWSVERTLLSNWEFFNNM